MKQLVRLMSKVTKSVMAAFLVTTVTSFSYADGPKISGFIDTTYNYNFDRPNSGITADRTFDRRSGDFLLNAVQVNLEGSSGEGIGYYGELAFGTDPSIYKSAGLGSDGVLGAARVAPTAGAYNFEIEEAYLTYKCPVTSVMLKVGKFVTFQGIEVIESHLNPTITRGCLFGMAEPYTHTGALAGYQVTSMIDVWAGVVNGWDVAVDNNNAKTFLGKVGLNLSEKISGVVSISRGAETAGNTTDRLTSIDTTWLLKPMSDITVAVQVNGGEQEHAVIPAPGGTTTAAAHWYGFGVQPTLVFTDKVSLGTRYEWFSDKDGARTGTAATGGRVIQNVTLTPTFSLSDALLFRTEYRYSVASNGMFEKSDGSLTKDSVSTVSGEFVYRF